MSGFLDAGHALFGNSANRKQLSQAFSAILADPSSGLNPFVKAVSGGEGVPSLAPDIIEGGASLLGLGEEAASGVGLAKFVLGAALLRDRELTAW